MIDRRILENAARDYNGDKYSEEFYTYHLKVLQYAEDISESVIRAVKYLFFWKLGKVRSKQTPFSSQLRFSDSKGRQYYFIHTTENHSKVIEKALEKERLKTAISFRNGEVAYDKFKFYADELTCSAIVLPTFYIHIWCPIDYPILDEKVWKIFCNEKGQPVFRYTKPRSWGNFEAYTSFFKRLVDDTGLDWRTVDKGLWVLGDRLKEMMDNRSIKPPIKSKKFASLDYEKQEIKLNPTQIPPNLLNKAYYTVGQSVDNVPFRYRGIMITRELIKITMELLNAEPTKTLPQNCRNDVRERTPDGLDRRIKESLNTDLRTANIISDVLKLAGIVKIVPAKNPQTRRIVKGTKLLREWSWSHVNYG